jgi:hypothetical protein
MGEFLNQHNFATLAEAQSAAATWLKDYKEVRPHSSLGYKTPREIVVRKLRQQRSQDRSRKVSRSQSATVRSAPHVAPRNDCARDRSTTSLSVIAKIDRPHPGHLATA